MKPKILLITYYWPPNGGAGVQRWLKMSKYLVELGYELTVYTPENPEFSAVDDSLLKDVHKDIKVLKSNIWEPYSLYKQFVGGKNSNSTTYLSKSKSSWFQTILKSLALKVRNTMFLPDPRVYWVKPSVKMLLKHYKKDAFDLVISTGPPHSVHLTALKLKKKLGVKWIADFRDPWTEIDFYADLNLSKRSHEKNVRLEQSVLQNADKIVTVSESWADDLRRLGATNVDVVYNGFDHADFLKSDEHVKQNLNTTKIMYFGSMNKDRNPQALWEALVQLNKKGTVLFDI